MTATATDEKLYTIEECLEMEEYSLEKHEYYNGQIRLMPGGTFTHGTIAAAARLRETRSRMVAMKDCTDMCQDAELIYAALVLAGRRKTIVVCCSG